MARLFWLMRGISIHIVIVWHIKRSGVIDESFRKRFSNHWPRSQRLREANLHCSKLVLAWHLNRMLTTFGSLYRAAVYVIVVHRFAVARYFCTLAFSWFVYLKRSSIAGKKVKLSSFLFALRFKVNYNHMLATRTTCFAIAIRYDDDDECLYCAKIMNCVLRCTHKWAASNENDDCRWKKGSVLPWWRLWLLLLCRRNG